MFLQIYLNSSHSFRITNSYAFSCSKEKGRETEKKEKIHAISCLLRLKANSTTIYKNKRSVLSLFPGFGWR